MRQRLLQVGVVAALVLAAVLLRSRDRLPPTPEETVAAFFEAAGRGDDSGYLRLTSGDLAKQLQDTRSQVGVESFRKSIQGSMAGIKGHAVSRGDSPQPDTVALDVELVYADRNERQRMLCARQGAGWVITSLETARMVKPAVPYGTPVYEEPPATVPPKGKVPAAQQ